MVSEAWSKTRWCQCDFAYLTWGKRSETLRRILFNFKNRSSRNEQETYIENTAVMKGAMEKDASGTSERLSSFPAEV